MIKTEEELIELQHKYKMEELDHQFKLTKKIEDLKMEHQKEMQRIKSADIQRNVQRRAY